MVMSVRRVLSGIDDNGEVDKIHEVIQLGDTKE